ncbi:VOC family protein [Streptomyces silvisoli]|uniref:Glyoxalase/fosfomycin resistance/dioxygenase domain-containing protein n=1 Tax=Streptomyces silvisoli TaxID=3034235 RepID=A0ABT5ZS90_9ACTN|nr:VOC family protein [Streptomyces silvisoli]MDF3292698.1 hypothetical protein [Streptomyces silvisoli]
MGQRGGLCMIMSSHHELTADQAKAVMQLFLSPRAGVDALRELAAFRGQSRTCLYRRGDALFELADAMLCTAGPVQTPVELPLEPEFLRRHSSVYDALHHGGISAAAAEGEDNRPSQPAAFGAYVTTADPDTVYRRAVAAGAEITNELHETDYGSRDFTAVDPEGNLWHFGTYRG